MDRVGRTARIVVASVAGSTPREPGAAMLVWESGQSGTIGGGTLEHQAVNQARELLANGSERKRVIGYPLGPSLGQCCGGTVTLAVEVYDVADVQEIGTSMEGSGLFARPVSDSDRTPPRCPDTSRASLPFLNRGWFVEQFSRPIRPLWIFGAGHVGRAIIDVVSPLSEFDVKWIDTSSERFPNPVPESVEKVVARHPAKLVGYAPENAEHLILTHSHSLDLEICHALLKHRFRTAGLIGSATKWSRFRKRLREAGFDQQGVDRIQCPIGDPSLGKRPQAIAIGVASGLLSDKSFHPADTT